ncbi:MAG: hypothetical protein LRY71_04800 [Bacillaceae bacterium]|nr:hypothetical protein [Bacillaceae bacterium]
MDHLVEFTKKVEKFCAVIWPLAFLFRMYYYPIVKREVMLANITKSDKVICIGGGSLPWTAVEIARQSGATVKVLDCDFKAVMLAKKFVKAIKMEEVVEVVYGNGLTFEPKDCTVIHLASQVQPQEQVLEHMLSYKKSSPRVLIRVPKQRKTHRLWDQCICECIEQKVPTIKATMLMQNSD